MIDNDIVSEGVGLLRLCANIEKFTPEFMPMYRNERCKLQVFSAAVESKNGRLYADSMRKVVKWNTGPSKLHYHTP